MLSSSPLTGLYAMTDEQYPEDVLEDPRARSAFMRLRSDLDRFATSHGLVAEQYRHGFAMWRFLFQHPKGGGGVLQLAITTAKGADEPAGTINQFWWIDDEERLERSSAKFEPRRQIRTDPASITGALEHALTEMLNADPSALDRGTKSPISPPLRDPKGNVVYGVFDVINLPIPRNVD